MLPNTFGLPATADRYIEARSIEDLQEALAHLSSLSSPSSPLVIGAGSNMVFTRHFPGAVLHMANKGIRLLTDHGGSCLVEAAAGEGWDDFVHHCIAQGWYGAENLVAIPGTVGAAPVQNVGAYGVEAKDIIHEVHTVEIATGLERTFSNEECRFGYRDSIFKHEAAGRYVVVSVVFRLSRTFTPNLTYKALSSLTGSPVTASSLANAITDLRWSKLPRPEEHGSAGSFFKNPVVPADQYAQLKARYPDLVAFPAAEDYKLAAGWLIEQAGWKGRTLGRAGVWPKQALVLYNAGGCTGQEVVALANAIISDVQAQFNVSLTPEAIII